MSHQDCRCELLVRSEVSHISVCAACRQVHLSLQYMSLRFEAGAFRALANMMNVAQGRMDCATADAPVVSRVAPGTLH